MQTARLLSITAVLMMPGLALAEDVDQQSREGWRELPRNTTIYVPVPREILPVQAYQSCANRYEGDPCDFPTPQQGILQGVCLAPEIRQPIAYGYQIRNYPAQVRTGLVCKPQEGSTGQEGGVFTTDPNNPGHEMPYAPADAAEPPQEMPQR